MDAPLVICHFINHAVKANCVVCKSIVSGTFVRQHRQGVHMSGWLK